MMQYKKIYQDRARQMTAFSYTKPHYHQYMSPSGNSAPQGDPQATHRAPHPSLSRSSPATNVSPAPGTHEEQLPISGEDYHGDHLVMTTSTLPFTKPSSASLLLSISGNNTLTTQTSRRANETYVVPTQHTPRVSFSTAPSSSVDTTDHSAEQPGNGTISNTVTSGSITHPNTINIAAGQFPAQNKFTGQYFPQYSQLCQIIPALSGKTNGQLPPSKNPSSLSQSPKYQSMNTVQENFYQYLLESSVHLLPQQVIYNSQSPPFSTASHGFTGTLASQNQISYPKSPVTHQISPTHAPIYDVAITSSMPNTQQSSLAKNRPIRA
jgi:hypothetical protein